MSDKNAGRLQGALLVAVVFGLIFWLFTEGTLLVIAGKRLQEAENRRAEAAGLAEVWQQELLRCNGKRGVKPYSQTNRPIDTNPEPPDIMRDRDGRLLPGYEYRRGDGR